MLIAWLLIALAGFAIGSTSIGGVLVVPALHHWMGLGIADAMAISSQAFFWTGLWVLLRLPRLGLDLLQRERVLLAAALLGAVLGAWLTPWVPAPWIRSWIGTLALASGVYGLWQARVHAGGTLTGVWPGTPTQIALGLLVGVGSALSGTGGPVMLLPLLMLRRCAFERSVQVALVLQVPIAMAATATHATAGRLDLSYGMAVAGVLLVSAEMGRRLSRRWSRRALQAGTAMLLIGTGLWLFWIG